MAFSFLRNRVLRSRIYKFIEIIITTKLAVDSVGIGQLQEGSVGELQIQEAAIGNAHIQNAASRFQR